MNAQIEQNRRIPSITVQHLCGDVSHMWVERRLKDPTSGFPKPQYIARRRYWREADIIAWLDAQPVEAQA